MHQRGLFLAAAVAAMAAVFLIQTPARATDYVISSASGPVDSGGKGDTITVTPGGSITAPTDWISGILSNGANTTITNNGAIDATGYLTYGIEAYGSRAAITNAGRITTSGNEAYGISAAGSSSTVSNSGMITTSGYASYGIYAAANRGTTTNSGTITTSGEWASGIWSYWFNNDATVSNSGTISVSGMYSAGIEGGGTSDTINNSGRILASGVENFGIYAYGADAIINNSGLVSAPDSYAIYLGSDGATLNLLRGTVLDGKLYVDEWYAPSTTLNISTGRSTTLHFDLEAPSIFDFSSPGALPGTINAPGMVLAVDEENGIVRTLDTANLVGPRAQGQWLGDMTSAIFAAVDGRSDGGAMTAPVSSYAPEPHDSPAAPFIAATAAANPYERTAWLKGFGAARSENGDGLSMDQSQSLAGLVSGIDLFASASGTGGVFFGGSWDRTDIDGSQDVTGNSVFGGAYGRFPVHSGQLDLALAFGWTGFDSTRFMLDNLAPGGVASAKASYEGTFVAPHAAWTQPFTFQGQKVEAKVSAQYAAMFLGSYAESGSAANLAMDAHTVQVFVARQGLAVPFEHIDADGSKSRLIPSFGIEERAQFGDSLVAGTLVGTGITFDADNGSTIGGYGGLRFEVDYTRGVTLFADSEGLVDDTGSARIYASGGMKVRF